jgi:hypothetical protein
MAWSRAGAWACMMCQAGRLERGRRTRLNCDILVVYVRDVLNFLKKIEIYECETFLSLLFPTPTGAMGGGGRGGHQISRTPLTELEPPHWKGRGTPGPVHVLFFYCWWSLFGNRAAEKRQ